MAPRDGMGERGRPRVSALGLLAPAMDVGGAVRRRSKASKGRCVRCGSIPSNHDPGSGIAHRRSENRCSDGQPVPVDGKQAGAAGYGGRDRDGTHARVTLQVLAATPSGNIVDVGSVIVI